MKDSRLTLGDRLAQLFGRRKGPIPHKWDRDGRLLVDLRNILANEAVQRQMDAAVELGKSMKRAQWGGSK